MSIGIALIFAGYVHARRPDTAPARHPIPAAAMRDA
jgi:hypothetical protein